MATLPIERPGTPLRQRMLDDMTMRAMKSRTQHDYVRHVRAFAAFLGRSPDTATARCQGAAARTWLAEREADLLPVGYFHVVFTLPAEVADVAFHNKALVYDLLFRAASETMTTIAADPRYADLYDADAEPWNL